MLVKTVKVTRNNSHLPKQRAPRGREPPHLEAAGPTCPRAAPAAPVGAVFLQGQGQNQPDESDFGFHDVHHPVAVWKELLLCQGSRSPNHRREGILGQRHTGVFTGSRNFLSLKVISHLGATSASKWEEGESVKGSPGHCPRSARQSVPSCVIERPQPDADFLFHRKSRAGP